MSARDLELESYEKRLLLLRQRIDEQRRLMAQAEREAARLGKEEEEVEKNIARLDGSSIRVTDHAIVRYLERVEGMDMQALRMKICPTVTRRLIMALWSGVFPVENTWRLRVEHGVVKTVLAKE